MDIVFKFCGSHGVDILRNLELKVTPPNQFNDPFEFTPRLFCSDPDRYAKRLFRNKEHLETFYEMSRLAGTFSGSFPDFRTSLERNMPEISGRMPDAMRRVLPDVAKKQLDRVSEHHGVLCMSRRRDSILMWGHYCDSARGLVTGFDKSSAFFQRGKGLRPVAYVRERVIFDANWKIGSPQRAAYDDKLIFSKNAEWSYEQELRQFFCLDSLTRKPLGNGTPGYFCSIPPSAVVSVTLSPRCSPQLETEVRTILQDRRFSHVNLDRAVLSERDFSLSFSPVP